jgi:hypothetical protein
MVTAVRSRGGAGNRTPGLVDAAAVKGSGFHFDNLLSLRFDSNSSEHVEGPAMQDVGTFTNQLTVACWHKWSASDGGPTIFDTVAGASTAWSNDGNGWVMIWGGASTFRFCINSSSVCGIASGLTATDWHFFVGVYDGSLGSANIKVYADGVVGATTANVTADITQQTNLVNVGKAWNTMDGGGTDDFTVGHTDEFAIWDTPLSADEITRLYLSGVAGFEYDTNSGDYVSADNLRLWWRLGSGGDTNGAGGIQDKSGNSNNGTLTDITSANFEEDVAGGGV